MSEGEAPAQELDNAPDKELENLDLNQRAIMSQTGQYPNLIHNREDLDLLEHVKPKADTKTPKKLTASQQRQRNAKKPT